jgi:dynein light intermediate chain
LENLFQERLQEKQARKSGICPIREELHNQLFDEIIRQATINLPERGILLMKIRDHLKMTFAAYQTLYEGSLVFGNRKAHVA